jgi:hypothetical protein
MLADKAVALLKISKTAACLVAKATPDISQARSAWIGAKG